MYQNGNFVFFSCLFMLERPFQQQTIQFIYLKEQARPPYNDAKNWISHMPLQWYYSQKYIFVQKGTHFTPTKSIVSIFFFS
jgi:hypothetical protein